jgi:adenylate kinase
MVNVDPPAYKKVVFCTGAPGNGRDIYLQSVVEHAKKNDKSVQIFPVFEYIRRAGQDKGWTITRENVLDLYLHNSDKMKQFRDTALDNIFKEVHASTADACLISTPSVFEWKGASMFGFETEHVRKLKPDFIVVVIDDLVRVRERLGQDPEWRDKEYSLEMIAKWRRTGVNHVWETKYEFEPPIQTYIIALEHDPDVLFDLLFTDKKRVYLSFAITGEQAVDLSKVLEFAKELGKQFVVFNPLTIFDWNLISGWKTLVDKSVESATSIPESFNCTIHYKTGDKTYPCASSEIKEIMVDARQQIVDRDYKMISSSDYLVAYHPRKDISAGVMCEMVHAKRDLKKVYAYYPFVPSPWFEFYADKIFTDYRELLKWLPTVANN